MADAQINELQSKLAEHRAQLAQIDRLLALKSNDDVLQKLKADLVQVIQLTEELTATRIAKAKPAPAAVDPVREAELAARAAARAPIALNDRVSAKFTGTVRGCFVSHDRPVSVSRPYSFALFAYGCLRSLSRAVFSPSISRVNAMHARTFASLRVLLSADGKWYTARVDEVGHGRETFVVTFLDYGEAAVVAADCVRHYVSCAADQISVGQAVRAVFSGDGLFYDAVVNAVPSAGAGAHGLYKVTFTQYGDEAEVPLRDITLTAGAKKRAAAAAAIASSDAVPETMEVPEYLRAKPTDTEEQKASKRRRLRAMKANHRQVRSEIDLNKRANSWQSFSKAAAGASASGGPASKKAKTAVAAPLPGVRVGPSIFAAPTGDGRVGVTNSGRGMTEFGTGGADNYAALKRAAGDEADE